jgi:hypothetical protein
MSQTGNIASGTVGGLLSYLDYAEQKGYATEAQVTPLRSATRQVFSTVDGKDFEAVDIRSLDIEEHLNRFENLVVGRYKQESLASYRARVKRAVAAYREYLDQKTVTAFRATRRPRAAAGEQGASPTTRPPGPAEPPRDQLVEYPFPLRSGDFAYLRLPPLLEREDAERLSGFIRALVHEPQRSLPPGQESEGGRRGG